jgi:hypothetical protein
LVDRKQRRGEQIAIIDPILFWQVRDLIELTWMGLSQMLVMEHISLHGVLCVPWIQSPAIYSKGRYETEA